MRSILPLPLVLLALLACAPDARAGGSPETTLVVVNRDSPLSWRVANTYVRMRGIPASHVCPIPAPPSLLVITIDEFRERIWKPIEDFIAEHGLEEEIDTVAYSVDFPFGVDYRTDFELKPKESGRDKLNWPPVASLTGVTYLHRHVQAKNREYLDLNANRYLRVDRDGELMPGHGFRNAYAWENGVEPVREPEDPATPDRYMLSTMLGFTGMQGNTVDEIEAYLRSAHGADGTKPKGTVYLMVNKDVRAKTRIPQFDDTEKALKGLGAEVVRLEAGQDGQDGKCPIEKGDVMGCVAGIAGFSWEKSKSSFLPGAIAEHLTSFGARFDGSGQTKISEYLRAGAAGSSGAVAEPYALWQKFPLATLHVHYREGCSLAESFYQTVAGPYQLLVVGDPLARPYADFQAVAFDGETKVWTDTVQVGAVLPEDGARVQQIELWLDGQRLGTAAPGERIELDTRRHADGEHDVRLVAVEKSPIETRSVATARVRFDNGAGKVTIKAPRKPVPWGETFKITGRASRAKDIAIVVGGRVLAEGKRIGASVWKAEVDSRLLGEGVTEVQARVTYADERVALSEFAAVEVAAPEPPSAKGSRRKPRRGKDEPKGDGTPGLTVVVVDPKGEEKTFTAPSLAGAGKQRFLTELRKHCQGTPKSMRITGEFEVPVDGTYRFALNAAGAVRIEVQGATVFEGEGLTFDRQAYTAVTLEAGWHPIELEVTPGEGGNGDLSLWIGGPTASGPLEGKAIRR